jgi:hypothetical protein
MGDIDYWIGVCVGLICGLIIFGMYLFLRMFQIKKLGRPYGAKDKKPRKIKRRVKNGTRQKSR